MPERVAIVRADPVQSVKSASASAAKRWRNGSGRYGKDKSCTSAAFLKTLDEIIAALLPRTVIRMRS